MKKMTYKEVSKAVRDHEGWVKTVPFNSESLTTYSYKDSGLNFYKGCYPLVKVGGEVHKYFCPFPMGIFRLYSLYDFFTCRKIMKGANERYERNPN